MEMSYAAEIVGKSQLQINHRNSKTRPVRIWLADPSQQQCTYNLLCECNNKIKFYFSGCKQRKKNPVALMD